MALRYISRVLKSRVHGLETYELLTAAGDLYVTRRPFLVRGASVLMPQSVTLARPRFDAFPALCKAKIGPGGSAWEYDRDPAKPAGPYRPNAPLNGSMHAFVPACRYSIEAQGVVERWDVAFGDPVGISGTFLPRRTHKDLVDLCEGVILDEISEDVFADTLLGWFFERIVAAFATREPSHPPDEIAAIDQLLCRALERFGITRGVLTLSSRNNRPNAMVLPDDDHETQDIALRIAQALIDAVEFLPGVGLTYDANGMPTGKFLDAHTVDIGALAAQQTLLTPEERAEQKTTLWSFFESPEGQDFLQRIGPENAAILLG